MKPAAHVALCPHDGPEFFNILLHRATDEGVSIVAPFLHFTRSVVETRGDLLLAFGAALAKPPREFIKAWRHDEDIRKRALDEGIVACADARCANRVDIEQDIHSGCEVLQHGGLQRSVKTAVHLRVLEKIPRFNVALEFLLA